MVEMQRESLFRHRSERLIDRFLLRAEQEKTEEIKAKLAILNKRKDFAVNQKRRKLENEEQQKHQKEQQQAEVEARRKKFENLDASQALAKILKHL